MASSIVSICNNALIRLGSHTITSLDEGTTTANACNAMYSRTVDTLLRKHLWNFTLERVQLAAEATAPAFGYSYSYPLPADFIRVKELSDPTIKYKIEGSKLLTDASSVKLVYVKRIDDVSKFDPLFTEALIVLLAINLCYLLIGSNSRENALKDELDNILFLAKQVDGQDDTPDSLTFDTFLDSRWNIEWHNLGEG